MYAILIKVMIMRIFPNMKKTLIMFSVISLIILVLFYFYIDGSFTWPLPTKDYILFGGWLIITLVYLFITIRFGYYTLEKKALLQRRLTKEYMYEYNHIIYIDEEWSRKNKILLFVTDRGNTIYLIMDKKQVLLDEMLVRCKNLIDKETLLIKFPNIRL